MIIPKESEIADLGVDLGLDKNLKLWIFEMNNRRHSHETPNLPLARQTWGLKCNHRIVTHEELIFRGVIMSALEYRWGKGIAIIVPSVIFGALHILGNELDILSTIQLLIAGSIVGILFSLVTYESGSIWCSALIHGAWNTIMIGGILHIGMAVDETSVFNYVLDSKSFFITGGDFGVEASIVSLLGCSPFSEFKL